MQPKSVCAKCGCETKGEVAWVQDEEWCHPCADNATELRSAPGQDGAESASPAHTPTPWEYRDVYGSGLEIRAPVYRIAAVELPYGMSDQPIKIFEFTAPQIVQVAAERWVQFEPKGWSEMQEANAAFIVKAVNSHDALVKALEKINSQAVCAVIATEGECFQMLQNCAEISDAALAKARE